MIEKFNISSSTIRVTDPCYTKDVWCSGVISNCLTGEWHCVSVVSDENSWGFRNAELLIWHSDYNKSYAIDSNIDTNIDVGVDSGQAGFFDDEQYPSNDIGDYGDLNSFYGKICNGTSKSVTIDGVERPYIAVTNVGFGVCCSSGFGDGSYKCFVNIVDDKVIAAKIVFISDEEDYEE